jgi:hypothetical protein
MRKVLHGAAFAVAWLLSIFATSAFTVPAAAEPIEIAIGVAHELGPRISGILEQYPDVCEQDDFFSDEWLRTSLEFVLVCRAIRLGGLEATYTIVNFPNSARTREELLTGRVAIMVDLPWSDFAQHENLYRSDAVLRVGDFVKGIYTRPDHTELLKVRTLQELRKFTAVSSDTWVYDWAALQRMEVKSYSVARYELMGRMVERGRTDFLVAEFPGASDLSQYINGFRFIPVPGIKVALPGSRHVAVSKRAPHAKQIFDAVQIGLKSLRERGLIKKGYQTVGFLNPRIEHWKSLCCDDVS